MAFSDSGVSVPGRCLQYAAKTGRPAVGKDHIEEGDIGGAYMGIASGRGCNAGANGH